MTRKIKFRAWNGVEMSKPFDLNKDDKDIFPFGLDLMQYTGIKDKNGKEIYESDICIHKQLAGGLLEPNPAKKVNIIWSDLYNGWICDSEPHQYSMQSSQLEVIGNIYQNKELIK